MFRRLVYVAPVLVVAVVFALLRAGGSPSQVESTSTTESQRESAAPNGTFAASEPTPPKASSQRLGRLGAAETAPPQANVLSADPSAGNALGAAQENVEATEPEDVVEDENDNLTPEQAKVLSMYEGLAKVLALQGSCDEIGQNAAALIEKHAAAVKGWAANQAALGTDGARAEQQFLEEVAPKRLKHVRDGIREGLAKCGGNPAVNAAIAKLATLAGGA